MVSHNWLGYIQGQAEKRIKQINEDVENNEVTEEKLREHLRWVLGLVDFARQNREKHENGLD